MPFPYFLGAYWPARRETAEQCGERLHRMFSEFAAAEETLATWHEQARSKREALRRKVDCADPKRLIDLLQRTNSASDAETGFREMLWNGRDHEEAAVLDVSCGSRSKWVGNSVILKFPPSLWGAGQTDRMTHILSAVAESWEPKWAGVISMEGMESRKVDMKEPFVDWMLYVDKVLHPPIGVLSATTEVRHLGKLGTLIVVQRAPPDAKNPDHLENIARVEQVLKRAR